jgi:hypothetical protein
MTAPQIPAVFIDARNSLASTGGGVQKCNQEYLAVLKAAGFAVEMVPFDLELSLLKRIANRLYPKISPQKMPAGLAQQAENVVAKTGARFAFFGLTRYPELSTHLRSKFPNLGQIIISHGVEAVDFCIDQQIRRRDHTENRSRDQTARMLGEELLLDAERRWHVDAALVLSPFEAEVEKWLGTKAVCWVPRTISEPVLDFRPVNGRVGCVSTLNHPPNFDGLKKLFEALAKIGDRDLRFRLVGRPVEIGRELSRKFPFVEFAGELDNAALRLEAMTWCCFAHPLFVNAKGCSTKLAVGLGWRLPIATTEFGARGYQWDNSALPLARTPAEMAVMLIERSRVGNFQDYGRQTAGIVAQTPSLEMVAQKIRQFFLQL